jgi:hypothetical protein
LQAQDWVGKRPDLVGVVVAHDYLGGGYSWFGASAPLVWLDKNVEESLVRNRALNYAIVPLRSNHNLLKKAGYTQIHEFGNYSVYQKDPLVDEPQVLEPRTDAL